MNKSKRGRKPKSNIIVNSSPIFDNNNNQNIILKIKKPKNKNKIEFPISNDNIEFNCNKYECKCCNKIILSNAIGLPLKYNNMCFYTVYNFCNFECVIDYITKIHINEYYEVYSLLKLYELMLKEQKYPIVKQVSYNNQIKNNSDVNLKYYKLQRKQKNKIDFFNIFQ
tara:strand:- start:60 stop:563 length:504 start_codon:yes stop_codon:yes gene_type:complete